jgi:hypothetical protein
MKRLICSFAIALAAALLTPLAAQAGFGLNSLGVQIEGESKGEAPAAGSHPKSVTFSFGLNYAGTGSDAFTEGRFRDFFSELISGLVADTTAYTSCTTLQFLEGECPDSSAVGVTANSITEPGAWRALPVYILTPPPGVLARFGFHVLANSVPLMIDAGLRQSPPYNAFATTRLVPQSLYVFANKTQLWGDPSDPEHAPLRGKCYEQEVAPGEEFEFEGQGGKKCHVEANPEPLLTLPTRCTGANATLFAADTYEDPGALLSDGAPNLTDPAWSSGTVTSPPFTQCEQLGFKPVITAKPTTKAAQSASGLNFALDVADEGLTSVGGRAQSQIRKAVVELPEGMTVNPSQAEGLEVCSEADLAHETLTAAPGEGCPQASKIGTVEVESPLVSQMIGGSLYVAKPYENLAGDSLIAVYMVFKSPQLGVIIKLPLRVEPDPKTGRLISIAEDLPQLPFSHFRLHFREGARAPLISPPGCGEFSTAATLYPWSGGQPVTSTSAFQVISGPNSSPCPSGAAPFNPGLEAGTLNNAAGRYSTYFMRITRGDGEQDITKLSQVLPPGVVGKIAGVPYCSDAAISQAASRTGAHGGQEELDRPSCPAASKIGRTVAGAGVGSQLTYVPGSLYLAGPYHGDPLSVVSVTPAVAGPFDAGTVVVRFALSLNPVTGEVELDGAASDPIPHVLKGIPLDVRDLQAYVDRPDFTLNATSCEAEQTRTTIWGGGTAIAPAPDSPVGREARYQAADCRALGFSPKLGIELRGGTTRGAHPALRSVVTPKPGDANFADAAVTLPHSAFLDQAHIRTICTRVQFAAGPGNGAQCPEGSVYGHARAWTPLLDEPLSGPVFLRSSNHNLPDLVVALHGTVDIDLDARIDSIHGGIRAIFARIPDAPVSRFILDMTGGNRGLIVNSRNLCVKPGRNRADADLTGQNGKRDHIRPAVRAAKCGNPRHQAHRRRG